MKFDYYIHDNLYSLDECRALNKKIVQSIDPNVKDLKAEGVIKTASVDSFPVGSVRTDLSRFLNAVIATNRNVFGFNIFETCDVEYLNYNKYSEYANGQYAWHSDKVLNEPYDLKLTAILNISTEPYEGGDLELFLNGIMPVPELRIPGSMIIFPSYIQHRVTPVTKGERITISRWVSGPTFN